MARSLWGTPFGVFKAVDADRERSTWRSMCGRRGEHAGVGAVVRPSGDVEADRHVADRGEQAVVANRQVAAQRVSVSARLGADEVMGSQLVGQNPRFDDCLHAAVVEWGVAEQSDLEVGTDLAQCLGHAEVLVVVYPDRCIRGGCARDHQGGPLIAVFVCDPPVG